MIRKQKKSMVLVLFLAILFVFVIMFVLFLKIEAKKETFSEALGQNQISLLKTYQKAEKALFYIDQSAKYASYQAINDLAANGGFLSESKCGTYEDFNLWNNEKEECYPNIKQQFPLLLDSYLNSYLKNYEIIDIPLSNYNFLIESKENKLSITGFASTNIGIPIQVEEKFEKQPKEKIEEEKLEEIKKNLIWPLDTKNSLNRLITSCIGIRDCNDCIEKDHAGLDIDGFNGDPVFVVADGVVNSVGGKFNTVEIKHEQLGYKTLYLHLSAIYVKEGEFVKQGQQIAAIGGYGPCETDDNCTNNKGAGDPTSRTCYKGMCNGRYGDHLHFEIKKIRTLLPDQLVDPLTLYDLDKLGLAFWDQSNCFYNKENYAYTNYIEDNVNRA